MSRWFEAKVIENRRWTETLFSLRATLDGGAPRISFEAGQFVRIALDIAGERIARPFSFVNAPVDPVLEFYGVVVPEGPLSPRLGRLAEGGALFVADNPSGFLVLSEVPAAADLWLVATGTGIAPFLSILRSETPWQRYGRVILVHGARYARELVYQDMIEAIGRARGDQFVSIKFTSGEKDPGALQGRVPAAIRDGRLQAAAAPAGIPISPECSQFMLCGNPGMLKDVAAALAERGLKKHRRRSPGQISVESFW